MDISDTEKLHHHLEKSQEDIPVLMYLLVYCKRFLMGMFLPRPLYTQPPEGSLPHP